MRTRPPDLLPIFRTNLQAELLAALFLGDDEATTAGELVERTSGPAASVYRELARLVDAGLIERERDRRGAGFRPAKDSPLYEPLHQLLERSPRADSTDRSDTAGRRDDLLKRDALLS